MGALLAPIFDAALDQGFRLRTYTVEEYDRLIEGGNLETTSAPELIDGVIVQKNRSDRGEDWMSIGKRHHYAVQKLARITMRIEQAGLHLSTQGPLVLSDISEPEPDACILRGSLDDYRSRKPVVADVACIFEVSDSSLEVDRGAKLKMYSAAGISQYVIVNLRDNVLEHYMGSATGLQLARRVSSGESLTLTFATGGSVVLAVDDIIPG